MVVGPLLRYSGKRHLSLKGVSEPCGTPAGPVVADELKCSVQEMADEL